MSTYIRAKQLEAEIAQRQKQLDDLKSSPEYTASAQFETKLRDLLAEYGKSLQDIVALLGPEYGFGDGKEKAGKAKGRRERQVKRYQNPHTGDVIETKGGNHKLLKEWKTQWGAEVVEKWVVVA